jgi:hypothetical protein
MSTSTMNSRVTDARLRRLDIALKPTDSGAEEAARQALLQKLEVMASRLRADGPIQVGDMRRHVQVEQDVLHRAMGQLEQLVADPSATDHQIERAVHEMRIARFKARLALRIASSEDRSTPQASDRHQPT